MSALTIIAGDGVSLLAAVSMAYEGNESAMNGTFISKRIYRVYAEVSKKQESHG